MMFTLKAPRTKTDIRLHDYQTSTLLHYSRLRNTRSQLERVFRIDEQPKLSQTTRRLKSQQRFAEAEKLRTRENDRLYNSIMAIKRRDNSEKKLVRYPSTKSISSVGSLNQSVRRRELSKIQFENDVSLFPN